MALGFLRWLTFLFLLVSFPLGKLFGASMDHQAIQSLKQHAFKRFFKLGRHRSEKVFRSILAESSKNKLDPALVLAVIEHESHFDPTLRGSHGEIGLMQIKPRTAEWIAQKRNLPWLGAKSLENPETNIEFGTAYLAILKERFSKRKVFLAAYNAGPSKLQRQIRKRRIPTRYASQVMAKYRRIQRECANRRNFERS